jgi:hypothetical protein
MTIWRWDGKSEAWVAVALHTGQPCSLSPYALLVPLRGGRCGLLARGEVIVNGLPAFPLKILADRDEIRAGGETVYFSADSPAEAVSFAAQEKEMACGRCKGKIKEGETVVQCPICAAWHHQTAALPCWTEDARCSGCDRSTQRINWQPEPQWRKSSGKKSRVWGHVTPASSK